MDYKPQYDVGGIAINSKGDIYVTNTYYHACIMVYDAQLKLKGTIGEIGSGDFSEIQGIAINSSDYIYITDSNNDRIVVFSPDGQLLRKWGSSDTASSYELDLSIVILFGILITIAFFSLMVVGIISILRRKASKPASLPKHVVQTNPVQKTPVPPVQVVKPDSAPKFPAFASLYVSGNIISLSPGAVIHQDQILGSQSRDKSGVIARIHVNPNNLDSIELENLSNNKWLVFINGNTNSVESGQIIKVIIGMKIKFGILIGEIRY